MTEIAASSAGLAPLIASLADNKYFLGRRYAEWCTAAPTLESAVAAAAMAQDEIGHARSFYPLLQAIAGVSEETEPETRVLFTNAPFLCHAFASWTDFVATNFLFDTALAILLEAARASSFEPLGQRARRVLEEEPLHWLHGQGWMRRLCRSGPGVRAVLAASCAEIEPQSLDWFDVVSPDLVSAGVLDAGPSTLRERFTTRVTPTILDCGLRET